MSTWEERMSQRAKAREAARVEAQREAERRELTHWEATLPALPGEERIRDTNMYGGHLGHLEHYCTWGGPGSTCSCGAPLSVVCHAGGDWPPCEICKARQIGQWAPEGTTP